jgi:amphi-Trp domain-containing protein
LRDAPRRRRLHRGTVDDQRRADQEDDVDLFEFETKEELRREEAAKRLRQLADELERHNEVALRREGMTIKVRVPDVVTFEFEVEIEDDESEIEVSISW